MTKSNILGYVAAFPIPEVLQGINAFARGARSVNPKAEVRVIWVNSWYDPGKEREAALTLISQGADIVTHHTDSTAVVQAAEEKGKWSFGYHSDMSKYGPKTQLTATTHQWGDYYTKQVQEVLAGTWKPTTTWGGYKEGMIKLAPLNAAVPADLKARSSSSKASSRPARSIRSRARSRTRTARSASPPARRCPTTSSARWTTTSRASPRSCRRSNRFRAGAGSRARPGPGHGKWGALSAGLDSLPAARQSI